MVMKAEGFRNLLKIVPYAIPSRLSLWSLRINLLFCLTDQGKLRHRDEGNAKSEV
jgi:hypothetical protein